MKVYVLLIDKTDGKEIRVFEDFGDLERAHSDAMKLSTISSVTYTTNPVKVEPHIANEPLT
jgi:hypothetical protein